MDVDINRITQSDYLLKLGINQFAASDFPSSSRCWPACFIWWCNVFLQVE